MTEKKITPIVARIGKSAGQTNVQIAGYIIELFSGSLYSSENKAFEELVANSFDAGASKVKITIPTAEKISDKNSIISIWDDGQSMGVSDLDWLWKIGQSNKTEDTRVDGRLQIGKFGIGKLSTYIITEEIAYICKKDAKYFAICMDYNAFDKDNNGQQPLNIPLEKRELNKNETSELIKELSQGSLNIDEWKDTKNWTLCILSTLKDKAKKIQLGRLKWILRCALPLNNYFSIVLNGEVLDSKISDISPQKEWAIGINHELYDTNRYIPEKDSEGRNCIALGEQGETISGKIKYFKNSLLNDKKADRLGRSHGIFLYIRNRLINLEEPLLAGMSHVAHGLINRLHIVIHADYLNNEITATRENVKDGENLRLLTSFLTSIFTALHKIYMEENKSQISNLSGISTIPSIYVKNPILYAIQQLRKEEIQHDELATILFPDIKDWSSQKIEEWAKELKVFLEEPLALFNDMEFSAQASPEDPIAMLDLEERKFNINTNHPFVINFSDTNFHKEILTLIGALECLSELYLLENNLGYTTIKDIVQQRDTLLRCFSSIAPKGLLTTINNLDQFIHNPTEFEEAVRDCFRVIGFHVTANTTKKNSAKSGEPDGFCQFEEFKNSPQNYSFVFDCKTTQSTDSPVSSSNLDLANIAKFKKKRNANFACVIVPTISGQSVSNGKVNENAKQQKVTIITVDSFKKLIYLAGLLVINFDDIKDLFNKCYDVISTKDFIDKWWQKYEKIRKEPFPLVKLINTFAIYQEQQYETTPTINSIMSEYNHKYGEILPYEQIETMLKTVENIYPKALKLFKDGRISLNTTPSKLIEDLKKIKVDKNRAGLENLILEKLNLDD